MDVLWDDYKSAFAVAESGSLSQAAKHLRLAHSTVLRHIDRLEEKLGVKLFFRHQRGYQLTEAGQVFLKEFPHIQHHFKRLENQIHNASNELSGNIVITTVPTYAIRLHPAIKSLRQAHPQLRVTMLATDAVIPLENGTVHVAIRPGSKPQSSDVVVKPIRATELKIYAHKDIAVKQGLPNSIADLQHYDWIMPTGFKRNISIFKTILPHIPLEREVYQSNHFSDIAHAIAGGMGLGVVGMEIAKEMPQLVETPFQVPDQLDSLWFVYHRDLRNSKKVAAFYEHVIKNLI
ncbi:LysR family transcriptional regulator [Parashewanella tropica]|uniref:LysR family transcriptional regulator n=1 Tax=Parashewanella tropica TaxID=2547970 RepID=UPI00105A396B|nr:LysR family transcriptional regulator [Parashewanella tropica]